MPPSLLKYGRSVRRGRSTSVATQSGSKDDHPPPYTGSSSSSANEKNETELYIDEATALEYYVEICPHEKLYFPRLQKIVNLPGFKTSTSNTEINALTQGSNKHYSAIDEEGTYQCVIQNGDSRSRFYACGEIKFSYARWYDPLKWTGPHPGLLLQSDWYLWLYHFPMEINTLDGVEQFYAANPVSLCPHTKLIDVVGPQRLLNSLQSYRQTLDPVLDYELKHVKKGKEECKYCHSSFQSELRGVGQDTFLGVTCIRLLGKADSPNDSIWLSQCTGSNVTKGPGDGFRSLSAALHTMKTAVDRVILKYP